MHLDEVPGQLTDATPLQILQIQLIILATITIVDQVGIFHQGGGWGLCLLATSLINNLTYFGIFYSLYIPGRSHDP